MKKLITILVAALAWIGVGAATAAAKPVLVVENASGDVLAEFSRSDLKALPQTTYRTATEFTDGRPEFSGPLVRDVLAAAGVDQASVAVATAANDYAIEIPLEEAARYDVILATSMDGRRLSLRDKGPIWVMYPLDSHEELQDPLFNGRLIWQTVRLTVK